MHGRLDSFDAPEAMQCRHVTASADFVLLQSARNMAGYKACTRRHFLAENAVLRFRTRAVTDHVKMGRPMPVSS